LQRCKRRCDGEIPTAQPPGAAAALGDEQKRALVAAAFAPGAIVAEVARRADVCSGQLYRWRQELRGAGAGFAAVVVTADADRGLGIAPRAGEPIEIEFSGVACLRIPPSTPPGLAAAVVQALVRR
jgi:transposase